MIIHFLEPPPRGKGIPERFAGCAYELYHFPDLANLYAFTLLADAGFQVRYTDAVLLRWSPQRFRAFVASDDAELYMIHSVILSKSTDIHWLRESLAVRPSARFIVHGPEPTRVPEEYLVDERVIVIRGAVEKALLDFVTTGERRGMSLLVDGKVSHVLAGDELIIDELPVPARRHPALARYENCYFNPKFRRRPTTTMLASRGCAYRCRFCVPNSISFARELEHRRGGNEHKVKPQIASAARVIAEFRQLAAEGFRSVMVVDDQFLWDKSRTLSICAAVAPLGIEWGILSRADFLTDDEVVAALAHAGCVSIDIGVESLDQNVLDDIEKDLRIEDVARAVTLLRMHGIEPKLNIMFGTSPLETSDTVRDTVRRLRNLPLDSVMFSVATPFKGTPFFDYCQRAGYLVDSSDDINPLGKSMISYPALSKRELEALVRWAYRSFYLRPGIIIRRLVRLGNLRSWVMGGRAMLRLLLPLRNA